jgi:hypothetical protein
MNKTIYVRDEDLWKAAQTAATKMDMSLSEFISHCLVRRLNEILRAEMADQMTRTEIVRSTNT